MKEPSLTEILKGYVMFLGIVGTHTAIVDGANYFLRPEKVQSIEFQGDYNKLRGQLNTQQEDK